MSERRLLLKDLFKYFQNGIRSGKADEPKRYLESIGLDFHLLNIGFNSGQFHHRQTDEYKQSYEKIGILTKSDAPVNQEHLTAYTPFAHYSVVFPLFDEANEIANFYAIRFKLDTPQHLYLSDAGLFPAYPNQNTKKLYITSNIIDAASLMQSKVLDQRETVLALNNGDILPQHIQAIGELPELKEIVLIQSGNSDIKSKLEALANDVKIMDAVLPDGHSLNDMWVNYGLSGIQNWLDEQMQNYQCTSTDQPELEIHTNKLTYHGLAAKYEVLGSLPMDYSNLKVSLHIITPENEQKHRLKLDLYEANDIESNLGRVAQKDSSVNINQVEADLTILTDLLEKHREKLFDAETASTVDVEERKELTPSAERQAIEFLSRPNLLKRIDEMLAQTGIVGEEQVRLAMFIIASTYKMPYPLHTLIQGQSGGGKSHLINAIAQCMPSEDVMNLTRITSKSFYHYQTDELINKLILVQDWDGLDEEAQFAFREMQSAGFLCSSTTEKDRYGNLKSKTKRVNAHFASMVATTRAAVYYDNMSRSIIIGIDEGFDQTDNIINYQNKKICGMIDETKEQQARQLLRNCMRVLKPFEVINPFADKISIPVEAQMKRRLNQQLQDYIAQITILNQYQRKRDERGRLITTIEDVTTAIETFFPALWLKIDELDSSTRQCFEKLKIWVKKQPQGTNTRFTERDARHGLGIAKSTMNEYMRILKDLEYITVADGSANRGFRYQITFWDDIEKTKTRILDELKKQIAVMTEK